MIGNQISAQELYDRMQTNMQDAIVVDVRSPDEFKNGSIHGAINIPFDQIKKEKERLAPYTIIYLYCFSGSRSELAMIELQDAVDATVYNLTGGVLAWKKSLFPLV